MNHPARPVGIVPLLLLLSLLASPMAHAEYPFSYQGQLASAGVPHNGPVEMTFRLWDAETGGSQVGGDIAQTAEVVDGLFEVVLDFGPVIDGSFQYLEIEVEGTTLQPRQLILPVPIALLAADVMPDVVWRQRGNFGTGPGDFIGTIDNAPFEIHVDSRRALRIEPGSSEDGPNLVAGHPINSVGDGVTGSTIAGGGRILGSVEDPNIVTLGNYSTIGGGARNTIRHSHAAIGGGFNNTVYGYAAVISGGASNTANGWHASIGGGQDNAAHGSGSTVGGGSDNSINALSDYATIPGGRSNLTSADYTFAAGRRARAVHEGAFVWADATDADFESTRENQFLVRATGGSIFDSSLQTTEMQLTNRSPGDHPQNPERWTLASVRQDGSAIPELHFHGPEHLVIGDPGSVFSLEAVSGQATFGRADKSMDLTVHGQVTAHERVRLQELDGSGSTSLCLNAGNYIATCSSSRRYKHDIATLENATTLIEQLRPVRYRWSDGDMEDFGLVAEEVAEIEPRLVTFDGDGRIEGVKYRQLGAVLIRALQEHQENTARIKAELAELRARAEQVEALAERNAQLEARLARLEAQQGPTSQRSPVN